MGAFSRKKKIYVSSSTYNLAGDIKDRIRYLPTIIAGHMIDGSKSERDLFGAVIVYESLHLHLITK